MSEVTTEELLPCPFCGCIPTLEPRGSGSIRAIVCTGEPCVGSGLLMACTATEAGLAISAWNTRAELSRRAAVPVVDEMAAFTKWLSWGNVNLNELQKGFMFDAWEARAALSAPSQPSAADKPVAGDIKPAAWMYVDYACFEQVTTNEALVADFKDKGIVCQSLYAVADLGRFVGALGAAESLLKHEIYGAGERYGDRRFKEYLSELQRLKQICEADRELISLHPYIKAQATQ